MNRNRRLHRLTAFVSVFLLAAWSFSCGGGGGGGSTPPGPLVATFTGSNPTPGALTVSMAGASSGGAAFSVRINVTDMQNFFGTAFRVTFSPASATFNGFSSTGSVLGTGAGRDFRAELASPGQLSVVATLVGQVQGVTVAGTQLLITLNFTATAATSNNAFGFGVAGDRELTTCPAPPAACSIVPDANLTWSGGVLTASR